MKMSSAKWRWCGKILSKYLKFISKVVVWFDFVQRMSMNIMFHLNMECYSTAKHLNENWSTTRNNLLHLQKKKLSQRKCCSFWTIQLAEYILFWHTLNHIYGMCKTGVLGKDIYVLWLPLALGHLVVIRGWHGLFFIWQQAITSNIFTQRVTHRVTIKSSLILDRLFGIL